MASITTWTRLEPFIRTEDMQSALQARIYDPLWMLARQWQTGEFQGEDTGSPIVAHLRGESAQLTRYLPGLTPATPPAGQPYNPRRQPLEPLIEREAVRSRPGTVASLVQAAEAGLHFLRLAGQTYRARLVRAYPMPVLTAQQLVQADDDSLRFLHMMAGRVPDGARMFAALRQGTFLTSANFTATELPAVQQAANTWAQWYVSLFTEPADDAPAAWLPERMEYSLAVAAPAGSPELQRAPGETVLTAREYYAGHPDWYDFTLRPAASLGAQQDRVQTPTPDKPRNPTPITRTVIPAPVTFHGMPAHRWWEFEDATVDFGATETAPTDLARMLMIEFAVAYANDWFVIPIDLPVGSVSQISSLVVTDTFGVRSLIPSCAAADSPYASSWRMYQLASDRGAGLAAAAAPPTDVFFLPPTLLQVNESKPLEEVVFIRDEMANLAWGIERIAAGLSGRPVNRREAYLAQQRRREQAQPTAPETGSDTEALQYRLMSAVPDYWIPFLPVRPDPASAQMRLRRGAMAGPDGTAAPLSAQSRILLPIPGTPLDLYEEEVPREGATVTRTYQLARWIDGSTHLWVGRGKQIGRGEASSGLRFDLATRI